MRCGKGKSCRCLISLLLAFCMTFSLALGCAGCGNGTGGGTGIGMGGGFGASVASMFLRKTEGTVAVADAEGADVAPEENLGLYSGYTVGTEEKSYAWIDLDKVKLAKLDANSEIAITKDGKNLSIDVKRGSLFFNVTEPLAEDETMEIRTSSMLVGIRGTCGWVTQSSVGLLEGTVTVTAGEECVTVSAGERARLTQEGTLEVSELTPNSIPDFVARELLDDGALQQTVLEASGLGVHTTYGEFVDRLENVVYHEMIDFEADGSPELLVIRGFDTDNREFRFDIYRMGADRPEFLTGNLLWSGGIPTRYACSLVERDGRWYVCCHTECIYDEGYPDGTRAFHDSYFGSVAGQDGGPEDWGQVDYFFGHGVSSISEEMWVVDHDEKGFADETNGNNEQKIAILTEQQAYLNKYTLVRELYATAPNS